MKLPTFSDIEEAAAVLENKAIETPLIESRLLNDITGGRIFLKAECLQRTGSFKFRGAFNALSRLPESTIETGVLATSSGNHAQGVAEAAKILGFDATIVMPADAPQTKKDRTIRSGATIVEYDRYKQDRDEVTAELAEKTGAPIVHPFENFHVIAGQGTQAREAALTLISMGLSCDRALVCAGGGGLMSGTLLALRHYFPSVLVHPVEPENYDDHRRSLIAGKICDAPASVLSICDAILTPRPGKRAFAIGKDVLAPGLVVSDQEALDAVAFAFNELKLVVEPGGAVALAALLSGKVDVSGETVIAPLSGGNIDASMMAKALGLEL